MNTRAHQDFLDLSVITQESGCALLEIISEIINAEHHEGGFDKFDIFPSGRTGIFLFKDAFEKLGLNVKVRWRTRLLELKRYGWPDCSSFEGEDRIYVLSCGGHIWFNEMKCIEDERALKILTQWHDKFEDVKLKSSARKDIGQGRVQVLKESKWHYEENDAYNQEALERNGLKYWRKDASRVNARIEHLRLMNSSAPTAAPTHHGARL